MPIVNEEKKKEAQNIILENRKKASISGVEDIDCFNEQTVVLYTSLGMLSIKGADLHINRLSVETGEVIIEGEIDSLVYSDSASKKAGGFMQRLFK